MMIKSHMQFV